MVNTLDSKCAVWSIENRCCKLHYDNPFKVNLNDLDINCKGVNNAVNCPYFKHQYLTENDIIRERRDLRALRKTLGLHKEGD